MKYTVRSRDSNGELIGELKYESFGQIEQAWLMGLVEPSDEILEDGHTKWRRADSFPLLVNSRRSGEQVWVGTWFVWILIIVAGATWALEQFREKNYPVALTVALATAMLTIKITTDAGKRSKPHG
jgi:hypothetical protein